MNVFKFFIGILTVNFTFSEEMLKADFFDILKGFLLYFLSLTLAYLLFTYLLFITYYVTHTHTRNVLLNISPFLLKCLSDFIFLCRAFRHSQIYTTLHFDFPLQKKGE